LSPITNSTIQYVNFVKLGSNDEKAPLWATRPEATVFSSDLNSFADYANRLIKCVSESWPMLATAEGV